MEVKYPGLRFFSLLVAGVTVGLLVSVLACFHVAGVEPTMKVVAVPGQAFQKAAALTRWRLVPGLRLTKDDEIKIHSIAFCHIKQELDAASGVEFPAHAYVLLDDSELDDYISEAGLSRIDAADHIILGFNASRPPYLRIGPIFVESVKTVTIASSYWTGHGLLKVRIDYDCEILSGDWYCTATRRLWRNLPRPSTSTGLLRALPRTSASYAPNCSVTMDSLLTRRSSGPADAGR